MEERLRNLESKSIYIIRKAISDFDKLGVLFSTGKDSLTCLHLIRKACFGEIPMPVIHIDTSFKFPEIYGFRDKITKEWDLNLIVAKNEKALDRGVSPATVGRFECCMELKTEALKQIIKKESYDALLVGIRRDESGIRNKERVMSPRDKNFRWNVGKEKSGGDSGLEALQDPEMSGWDLFATDFGKETDHVRVHPMLHWTELDVWKYIKQENLPINPLYSADYVRKAYGLKNKRYRSLGCMPCTQPITSIASTIDEIISELQETKEEERAGRSQDKEQIMHRLRALGYLIVC